MLINFSTSDLHVLRSLVSDRTNNAVLLSKIEDALGIEKATEVPEGEWSESAFDSQNPIDALNAAAMGTEGYTGYQAPALSGYECKSVQKALDGLPVNAFEMDDVQIAAVKLGYTGRISKSAMSAMSNVDRDFQLALHWLSTHTV